MRISGEGGAGLKGGRNGDLYVFVSVGNHKLYTREGADLHAEIPISFAKATLGGKISLPAIDGRELELEIKEGSQNGHQIRMKGQGMPVINSSRRGDLYIGLRVEVPVRLNARQKEILEEFERISAENHPEQKGFFDKLKSKLS